MRSKLFFQILIFAAVFTIIACGKEKEQGPTTTPFAFTSLTAEQTTISSTQNTKITATATGVELTYNWSVTGTGSLIGSGNQITYQPCCAGENTINCLVKDKSGKQESKSVVITVQKQ